MKSIINIFFIFTFICSFGQKQIGIGIVSINFDDKTKIDFYTNSELKIITETIELYNDKSINSWNIKDLNKHKTWLKPESLWLDYGQFTFRCKTEYIDCYELYISDSKTMWIEKESFTMFVTWETYLKSMFNIELKDNSNQKIFSNPSISSEVLEFEDNCFVVKQMKGDWVELEYAEHCGSNTHFSGWTKWRDDLNILLNYFVTS